MNCPQSLTNKMRLSYILMGDTDSDDFKTVALYLTYRTIEQKPNVTMIQLASYLQHFGLKADVVEKSVAMLAGIHTVGEGCISVWKRPKSGIQHVNLSKKTSSNFADWLAAAREAIPALVEYDNPRPASFATPLQHQTSMAPITVRPTWAGVERRSAQN